MLLINFQGQKKVINSVPDTMFDFYTEVEKEFPSEGVLSIFYAKEGMPITIESNLIYDDFLESGAEAFCEREEGSEDLDVVEEVKEWSSSDLRGSQVERY